MEWKKKEWIKEDGSREGSPPCGFAPCRACGPAHFRKVAFVLSPRQTLIRAVARIVERVGDRVCSDRVPLVSAILYRLIA